MVGCGFWFLLARAAGGVCGVGVVAIGAPFKSFSMALSSAASLLSSLAFFPISSLVSFSKKCVRNAF